MNVRNASTSEMSLEHGVKIWELVKDGECKVVEHVEEFIVEKELELHRSKVPAEEFYYILSGRGIMRVENEEREVGPGDLIIIPVGALHGIKVKGTFPIHALSWKCILEKP